MKKTFLLLMFMAWAPVLLAQNALADLKFEDAETAFSNGNYKTAITKLDEFDKIWGAVTSKSLYLRIISQDKLFTASLRTGYLGLSYADAFSPVGAKVSRVAPGYVAEKAGIKVDDIIYKVNETVVNESYSLVKYITSKNPGEKVSIYLKRDNKDLQMDVYLSASPVFIVNVFLKEEYYELLASLRKNVNAYLKAMEKEELDDKYREVYKLVERLKPFPKDKAEWLAEKERYEEENKKELAKLRQKDVDKENGNRTVAPKLNAWEISEGIKIGGEYKALKKQYPELYKKLKKSKYIIDQYNNEAGYESNTLNSFSEQNGYIYKYTYCFARCFYDEIFKKEEERLQEMLDKALGKTYVKYTVKETTDRYSRKSVLFYSPYADNLLVVDITNNTDGTKLIMITKESLSYAKATLAQFGL